MILSKHKGKCLAGILLMMAMLILLVLPTFAEEKDKVSGKTYYVSSTAGDDSNSGLSEEEAWKSLSKLSEVTLGPGEQILLKCGDEWLGEQMVVNSPAGTAENPAKLGTYGEGDKPKVALFEDEVPKYSADPLILIKNAEHFVIEGLDVGFCGVGIELFYELVTNKENVRIQDCHFHDIYGFYQTDRKNITKYPHATGIVVTSNVPIPGCEDPVLIGLYIDNCTSYDAGALYTYGSRVGSSGYNVKNLYVTDCVMENNGIYGIAVCSMDGGYMDNCKIIDCGSRYSPMGSMGIMVSGNNFTIMNSEICYQQRQEDNPDGGGIDFEHLGYDIDVINCYIHDNSGLGVMMYSSGSDASHQNKRVRFIGNVFENNNQNVYKPGGAEIASVPLYSMVDSSIYNNRYMESRNLFTMNMDASVNISGNVSYPQEQQGKVWPVYDFEDVRAYVIDGTPLPSLDVEPTNDEKVFAWISNYGSYFLGIGVGLIVTAIVFVTTLIVSRKKKAPIAAMLLGVSLVGTMMPGFTSSAAESAYRLSEMCTDEMGLWQYYWYDGKETNVEMVYDSEAGRWTGDTAKAAIIDGTNWHPHSSGYTLATFTCPESGTVRIGTETPIELTNAANSKDGTIFAVMSDDMLVGTPVQVTPDNTTAEYETIEMDVYKGQVIGFYLHMCVNNAGDSTKVSPFVEYVGYKEVAPAEKEEKDTTTEEKVLRTDIKPMTIKEDTAFGINPTQIAIGGVPVIAIGVLGLILILKKGKKKNE